MVPQPYPQSSTTPAGMGPKRPAKARSRAAPVGVQSSAAISPGAVGTPASRWAVAGAGTGRRPWAVRTVPLPTMTGEAHTASGASRCIR